MSSLPHTIAATWERDDGSEVEVEITYAYTSGSPDTYDGSRGGPGGWDPGYPAEVEFISAKAAAGNLAQQHLDDWAREWLREEGRSAAIAQAEDDLLPDPDAAYDAMRDDRMTGDW